MDNKDLNTDDVLFGDIVSGNTDFFGEEIETEEQEAKIVETPEKKEEAKTEIEVEPVNDTEDLFGENLKEEEKSKEDKVEKIEKEVDKETESVDYLKRTRELIAQGIWEDIEGIEDLEELTEEDYEELKTQQKEFQAEQIKEKVLSELDEDEKEFLEYKKAGGNLEKYTLSLFNKRKASQLDITTVQGKKEALFEELTTLQGLSKEEALEDIAVFEKAGKLEEKAEKAFERIQKVTKENHTKLVQEQKQREQEVEQRRTKFIEDTKNSLKENGLDTKKVNQVLKNVSQLDENGYTEIDKAFLSVRNDPKKIKALHDFLLDYDNFEKSISQKKVNDDKLTTVKKLKFRKRKDTDVVEKEGKKNYIEL